MDIERLKELKDYMDKCLYHATNEEPWENSYKNVESHKTVIALIDETIARQSVASEEVAEAIETLENQNRGTRMWAEKINDGADWEKLIKTNDLAIQALQEYQPWVPVSERLPESGMPVLVTYIGHNDGKPYSDGVATWRFEENGYKGGWVWESDGCEVSVEITHWKPIPEPPKGE